MSKLQDHPTIAGKLRVLLFFLEVLSFATGSCHHQPPGRVTPALKQYARAKAPTLALIVILKKG